MENKKKKLLYIAPMAGGISFSDVSYEIFRVFKEYINFEQLEIYIFVIGICKSHLKVNLVELTGIPSKNIILLDDISTPNKHDFEFYKNYVSGYFSIENVINYVKPECIFMLHDNGQINAMFQIINKMEPKYNGLLVPYIPIDFGNITEHSIKLNCDLIFTPTDFTRNEIINYNGTKTPVKTLHHIVNNPKFRKLNSDIILYLKEKYLRKENVNKFIIGSFNANSIRKRWDLVLETFATYYKLNDESILFIKTNSINSTEKNQLNHSRGFQLGPMIQNICKEHDIPETAFKLYHNKVSIEELNEMFNIIDISINTTDGEGFGCFPLELALAEKLTILPNYTSYKNMFINISDNNFLLDVKEYPSTLIRDNNNIKDIIMGTKYFGIYHNNNSVYEKKINFVGKFTEISIGIDTIVISSRGKDEFIPNFNNNTGINGINVICHARTMSFAYEIIKTLERRKQIPNQIQIIISCETGIIMETYNYLCVLKNDLKNKIVTRNITISHPNMLKRYHFHLSPRVGIVDPVDIANRILFYDQEPELLKEETKLFHEIVKKKFNEEEFIKVFKEGMDSIGFEIPLKNYDSNNLTDEATDVVPKNNV